MPTYPVINKESKETKVLTMTMKEYSKWREDNPEWDRDWSQGCASTQEMFRWSGEPIPVDGMKSWIVHLNNRVLLSAKTAITNSNLRLCLQKRSLLHQSSHSG